MAVTRTILPRKGFIQSQHGLVSYEADQDTNWSLLDSNVVFVSDQAVQQLGVNGVVSGFTLSASSTLTPGLTTGTLYAQGKVYAPATAPTLNPAPASQTSYLFYNSASGFYYQPSPVAAASDDALIGQVVTDASAVTAVTQGTRIFGQVDVPATAASGNFTVQHFLGRTPRGAVIQMTSGGAIWFQLPTLYDATNLYLVASAADLTAKALLW